MSQCGCRYLHGHDARSVGYVQSAWLREQSAVAGMTAERAEESITQAGFHGWHVFGTLTWSALHWVTIGRAMMPSVTNNNRHAALSCKIHDAVDVVPEAQTRGMSACRGPQ